MGLQRHSSRTPRSFQTLTSPAAGTPPQLCTFRPAPRRPNTAKGTSRPPARTRRRREGTQFSSHHGRAAKRRMYFFTETTDPAGLAQIADTLSQDAAAGRLGQVIDRWIYTACLIFGLDLADQGRSGFRYAYSVYQAEYSRNLLFP